MFEIDVLKYRIRSTMTLPETLNSLNIYERKALTTAAGFLKAKVS